jgi:hypothetical protein
MSDFDMQADQVGDKHREKLCAVGVRTTHELFVLVNI